jgi:hypothetical protein
MLRASAQTTETEIDIQGINGDTKAAALSVEYGAQLMIFAEALAGGNADELQAARESLQLCAGDAVLVEAAGVAANFQRMVRIADSMGIPVDDMETELGIQVREELGIHRFRTGENTLNAERGV